MLNKESHLLKKCNVIIYDNKVSDWFSKQSENARLTNGTNKKIVKNAYTKYDKAFNQIIDKAYLSELLKK